MQSHPSQRCFNCLLHEVTLCVDGEHAGGGLRPYRYGTAGRIQREAAVVRVNTGWRYAELAAIEAVVRGDSLAEDRGVVPFHQDTAKLPLLRPMVITGARPSPLALATVTGAASLGEPSALKRRILIVPRPLMPTGPGFSFHAAAQLPALSIPSARASDMTAQQKSFLIRREPPDR